MTASERIDRIVAATLVAGIVGYFGWRALRPATKPMPITRTQATDRPEALVNDEAFHIRLGMAYAEAGLVEQALFEQKEALRLNARSVPALNNLGYYSFVKGNYPAAIAALREALRLDPQFIRARNNLEIAYARAIETAPNEQARATYRRELGAMKSVTAASGTR